jgi:hypothetical protein
MAPEQTTIMGFRVHPAADLFPIMEDEALEELARSIQAHGLREAIKVLDHQILDGRNRALALDLMGHKNAAIALQLPGSKFIKDITLPPGLTAVEYVAIENLHRRHLTADQRKRLAGELAVRIKAEQKAKPKPEKVDALAKAATVVGVSRRTVARGVAEVEGKPKLKRQPVTSAGLIADAALTLEAPKPVQSPSPLWLFTEALQPYLSKFTSRLLDMCQQYAEAQFALNPDANPSVLAKEAWARVEQVLGETGSAA